MEPNLTGDWDWELLVNDPPNPNPHPNPNPQIRSETEADDTPISDANLIRSDYFSLQFNSQHRNSGTSFNSDTDIDTGMEANITKSDSESGSWNDPTQAQFSNNRAHRKRKTPTYTSTTTSASASASDSDSPSSLHPHHDCNEPPSFDLETEPPSLCFSISASSDTSVTNQVDSENNGGVVEQESPAAAANKQVWWKVPVELFKYCVLRVRPVWSLSMAAAAIMGFVLLRRAWLSKMKRKAPQKGLRLNLAVDDKKVSQFMSRAARLNEAFSVVRRVPIIRPSLPAPGSATWPVISMR